MKYRRLAGVVFLVGAFSAAAAVAATTPSAAYEFSIAQMERLQGAYDEALAGFRRAVELDPSRPYLRIGFAEFLLQLGREEEAVEMAAAAQRLAPENVEALRLSAQALLRLAERTPSTIPKARDVLEQLRRLDPNDATARVTLGRLYLRDSRHADAVEVLREAWALQPRDRLVGVLYVEALEVTPDTPEQREELRRLLAETPDFLQARLVLAGKLGRAGDDEELVELLEAAGEDAHANVQLLRQLALAYYRTGRWQKAETTVERWLQEKPGDVPGRYLLALSLAAMARDAEAEEVLRKLHADEATNVDFGLALAELVERQGRRDEAARLLATMVRELERTEQAQGALGARVALAELYMRARRWDDVLAATEVLQSEATERVAAGALLLRSVALEELGRPEEALAAVRAVPEESGLHGRAMAREAELLFRAGDAEAAERALLPLRQSSSLPDLLLAAETLNRLERYETVIPLLRRASRQHDDSVEVLFLLGAALERRGRSLEAEKEFQEILSRDRDFAPALNYLGYMWAEEGRNLEQAVELVTRAVELEPNNGAFVDSLGWALFKLGDYENARGYLERAAELVRDDAVVFEHLGDLYHAVGELQRARQEYRKALELGGENIETVRRKLKGLETTGDSPR